MLANVIHVFIVEWRHAGDITAVAHMRARCGTRFSAVCGAPGYNFLVHYRDTRTTPDRRLLYDLATQNGPTVIREMDMRRDGALRVLADHQARRSAI